jgi:tRNA threonylcarbamoyladenosine modification (KEOPS) complex  Pcc1 subunit
MHVATLSLGAKGAIGLAVEGALSVEAGGGLPKVSVDISRTDEEVRVRLAADDLPSLRAALNSFLRWAAMAAEVAAGVEVEDPGDMTVKGPAPGPSQRRD